jgi:acyl-CoA reductase-like NAD-dependent aldehyde dehydrogenase
VGAADADPDEAVAGALACTFRNSGQTCISANRILVQDAVYDEFASRVTGAAARLRVATEEEAIRQAIDTPYGRRGVDGRPRGMARAEVPGAGRHRLSPAEEDRLPVR